PKTLFGGFDRKTTRQLVARIDATYRDLFVERERLVAELEKLRALYEQVEKREQELTSEGGRLKGEGGKANEVEKLRQNQLDIGRTRWHTELEKARADLEHELKEANATLAEYRQREILLDEVLRGARLRAKTMTDEARAEADRMLRNARRREAQITRD